MLEGRSKFSLSCKFIVELVTLQFDRHAIACTGGPTAKIHSLQYKQGFISLVFWSSSHYACNDGHNSKFHSLKQKDLCLSYNQTNCPPSRSLIH